MELTVVFRLPEDEEDLATLPPGSRVPDIGETKILGGIAYRVIDRVEMDDLLVVIVERR